MKQCSRCKIEKPLQEFHKDKNKSDGHSWWCKSCKSEDSTINHKLSLDYVRNIKKISKGCEKCGEKDIACLDFHHLDSNTKEYSIGRLVALRFSKERLDTEISKCIILCSNCHRKLHYYE